MRRFYTTTLTAAVLFAALAIGSLAAEKMMSVSVKETPLRATPTFMGKIVTVLQYTDRVEVLEERSGWARVSLSGAQSAQSVQGLHSLGFVRGDHADVVNICFMREKDYG